MGPLASSRRHVPLVRTVADCQDPPTRDRRSRSTPPPVFVTMPMRRRCHGAGAGQNDAADVPMDIPVVSGPFAGTGNGDLAIAFPFRPRQEHVSEHVGRRQTRRQPRPERVVACPESLRVTCRQPSAPARRSREHGSSSLPAWTRPYPRPLVLSADPTGRHAD